ncbi:single-stranded DNA-binding protein [Legionella longbeachae]|nr:single-stranded DNA-binding protein [Legionella longbeachae]
MMALGINKVILLGNVGNAPEVRQTTEGNAIATLSLATSETWKDKQTGEKKEEYTACMATTFWLRLKRYASYPAALFRQCLKKKIMHLN